MRGEDISSPLICLLLFTPDGGVKKKIVVVKGRSNSNIIFER